MLAFGVFQGGGVKGFALAGALEVATDELGYDFTAGVAGTSAGVHTRRSLRREMDK